MILVLSDFLCGFIQRNILLTGAKEFNINIPLCSLHRGVITHQCWLHREGMATCMKLHRFPTFLVVLCSWLFEV